MNPWQLSTVPHNFSPADPTPARWIPWIQTTGCRQMAMDLCLLDISIAHPEWGPSLRIYNWSEDTLSLGYHQPTDRLAAYSHLTTLPWIRRPTGGRAVFHAGSLTAEVTYSLVMPPSVYTQGSRRASYWRLCEFLRHGLALLGVRLDPTQTRTGSREYTRQASCFATSTAADLTYQGYKLMGNAQVWRQGHVLQHGTLLLQPDRERWETLLPGSTQGIIGLAEILQRSVTPEELQTVFRTAAAQSFNYAWSEQDWEPHELTHIDQLALSFHSLNPQSA